MYKLKTITVAAMYMIKNGMDKHIYKIPSSPSQYEIKKIKQM